MWPLLMLKAAAAYGVIGGRIAKREGGNAILISCDFLFSFPPPPWGMPRLCSSRRLAAKREKGMPSGGGGGDEVPSSFNFRAGGGAGGIGKSA